MALNANGNDDYEPAYLSFDDFFVDPMAGPFFNNQSPSTAQNANLPVASAYSTPSSGCLTALDSKPSCPPPFPKQSNVPIFSAPTFPGCLSMSSHLRPASLVKGNTIYGSRCGPNSDRKFQSVSRPTHLGTVAAQPCVPHTMTSRSYERNDTVIATPVGVFASTRSTLSTRSHTSVSAGGFVMQPIPQYADLPGYPSGIRPIYSSGFRLKGTFNYPPAVPVYSSPSYESYLDAGYSSNYSLKDHHSAYQLPDVTKHSESMLANANPNNQYACAGFGAFLNDLKPTSLSKKEAIRKRCRAGEESGKGKSERCSKSTKSPHVKRKYTKKNTLTTTDCPNDASTVFPEYIYTRATVNAQPETIPKSNCLPPTIPVHINRSITAAEKGQFLFRISDIHNSDDTDDVLWCVINHGLLQKYILKDIDEYGSREYVKSDNFCGWMANEPWRYYPINAVVHQSEKQETVVVSPFPSKDEIMRYRVEKLREMSNVDVQFAGRTEEQHNNNNVNIYRTAEKIIDTSNDDVHGRNRLSNEIAQHIDQKSFIHI